MSEYKVGGIAAMFSEPKEPTTESGKKLQSLFKEFHSKNRKGFSRSFQKGENNIQQGSEKTENQRVSKNEKKRKFSAVSTPESNEVESNSKKLKKIKKQEGANLGNNNGKQNFLAVEDFPRKKKSFKANRRNFNSSINTLETDETGFSGIGQVSDASFKTKNISNDKKKVSSFIRKSKQQRLAATNGITNSKGNENMSGDEAFNNDSLFKDESEEFSGKKAKKLKKKKYDDNFVHNAQSNHTYGKDSFKSQKGKKGTKIHDEQSLKSDTSFKDGSEEFSGKNAKKLKKKKYNDDNFVHNTQSNHTNGKDSFVRQKGTKIPNEQSLKSDASFKMEVGEFIRNAKKKVYGDNSEQNSQPNVSEEETSDFIKVPGLKSDDNVLSRTLFVGNLPINSNRKALRTLFSPFGEIENIRYFGIETDKAKIFREDGPQPLNANNYAADSVPGFITFCDRQSAVKALSLSGSIFKDHHITVDFALPAGSRKLYDDKRSIFIGNLPFDCKDEIIWEAFAECGRIEGVRIVRDKKTGIGKGFGYVQFSTVQSKENALALEDLEIQGRSIRIKPVESNKAVQKKAKNPPPVRQNTFKSRAIRIKMNKKESGSRKSVKKIMKKQKKLHDLKRTANILQKCMKS